MKKFSLFLFAAVLLSSCAGTCPAFRAGIANTDTSLFPREFLTEGMAGKKDKSGYRFKKKPSKFSSLITFKPNAR